MKIHQIVSEADPISALRTGWNAYRAARNAAPAVANATRRAATTAATRAATGGRAAATAAADTASSASWWEREAARIGANVTGREAALAAGAIKSKVLASKADDIIKFMYTADMIKEATVYWYKATQIEKDPSKSPEQKEEAIRQLRGELILSVIAPKVGAWGISKLAFPLKIIPWLTKVSGSPNAAELMKYLSKRGVEAALITWFGAGEGKKWLTDTFGVMVTGVGSLPDLVGKIYDVAKAATQVATGNLPDGFKKSDQEIDVNDPMSIMNRAGGAAGGFDPFKGTGRGGK